MRRLRDIDDFYAFARMWEEDNFVPKDEIWREVSLSGTFGEDFSKTLHIKYVATSKSGEPVKLYHKESVEGLKGSALRDAVEGAMMVTYAQFKVQLKEADEK